MVVQAAKSLIEDSAEESMVEREMRSGTRSGREVVVRYDGKVENAQRMERFFSPHARAPPPPKLYRKQAQANIHTAI